MSDIASVIDRINRDFLTPPGKSTPTFIMNDSGGISATDTSVITDTTNLSPEEEDLLVAGRLIEIDSEIMRITAVSGTSPAITLTLEDDGTNRRAMLGTTAATHADAADIHIMDEHYVPRLSIFNAVADSIVSLWPDLWTVGVEEASTSPSPIELPDYAGDVLDIQYQSGGLWVKAGSWDELQNFPYVSTERAVQVRGVVEGASALIYYKKIPQRPSAESTALADIYVNAEWVDIVVLGAVARLMGGFPLQAFDIEFITQLLRAENQRPGEGIDIRNSLLQLRSFLIGPLQRQLTRYNRDEVYIDKSY